MSLSLALGGVALGALAMLPFLFAVHWNGFETDHFGGYFRVATVTIVAGNVFAGLAADKNNTVRGYWMVRVSQTAGGMTLGVLLCAFSLMFGIREATIPLCQGTAWNACLEQRDEGCTVLSTQEPESIHPIIAFLHLLGLSFSLCSQSYSMFLLLLRSGLVLDLVDFIRSSNEGRITAMETTVDESREEEGRTKGSSEVFVTVKKSILRKPDSPRRGEAGKTVRITQ